jgi:hypothetical protein
VTMARPIPCVPPVMSAVRPVSNSVLPGDSLFRAVPCRCHGDAMEMVAVWGAGLGTIFAPVAAV